MILLFLSPLPLNEEIAKLAFSVHDIRFEDIEVCSMNDFSFTRRAESGIVNVIRDISDVNIPQAILLSNLIS